MEKNEVGNCADSEFMHAHEAVVETVRSSLPGAQIVIADCGLTAEARGLADYLAEREDNAAVVNGADFRLDAGN